MSTEEQETYEKQHSERTRQYVRAAAVAVASWQMAICLGNAGVPQQDRYFAINDRVRRLMCETNDWIPNDLTDQQRLFIDEHLAKETVQFLAAAVLTARREIPDARLKPWMTAHTQVTADIEKGSGLPKYERTTTERARMLAIVVENVSDELEFLGDRAERDAGCLTDEQRDRVLQQLEAARGHIDRLAVLLGDAQEAPA